MADTTRPGSHDARWFIAGVLVVAGVLALVASQRDLGVERTIDRARGHIPRGANVSSVADDTPARNVSPVPTKNRAADRDGVEVLAGGIADSTNLRTDREWTADELLTAAREAHRDNQPAVAYRWATMSARKKRTEAALEIKAMSACRLGNKASARTSYDGLSRARRRNVRRTCRKHGVWLGL